MNIGKAIKDRRKELKLSQGFIAKEVNISQTYMSQIENGHGNPTIKVIQRISIELSISPAYLLFKSMNLDIDVNYTEKIDMIRDILYSIDKGIVNKYVCTSTKL
jgi:transcriptional regulator with XRE-family HTH domain